MSELPGVLGVAAEVLDVDQALALARRLAGTRPVWPVLATIERLARDHQIRRDWRAGSGLGDLAQKFGLSTRQVRRIIFDPAQK